MTWPAAILWVLILLGLISRGPLILYLFSATVIFGGLTMAPAGLTGGLNLPAQTICAAILIAKIFLRADNLHLAIKHGLDIRKLGFLGFFLFYIVATAVIYPRLFSGDVMLYSLNAAATETPLSPTSANFTQTMYLMISIGVTFAFAMAGRSPSFRVLYLNSILLAAALLVTSGLVDLAFNAVGKLSLLQPFHNAAYKSLDTVSLAGQYRVVGFMPEASSFGAATCTMLSFLVFNYRSFPQKLRRFAVPGLIAMLGVMTFLSTSSTGYLGLAILVCVALGRLTFGFFLVPLRSQTQLRKMFIMLVFMMAAVAFAVVLGPFLILKYHALLNTVIFDKTRSSSYLERTRWTDAGLQAFFATDGVGVGIGSVRTSNWFVNILASTGIIGVGLFFAFVMRLLYPGGQKFLAPEDRRLSNSLKLSLVPPVAMIAISGTTPDPGVWVMSIFGILYGLQLQARGLRAGRRHDMVSAEPASVSISR